MRNLLQTHSVSWAQTVRFALEAEGISATVLDENAPGYMGFAGRVRVAVLNDHDLERARTILSGLAPPILEAPASWKVQKRGLVVVALGFLLMFVSAALFDQEEVRIASYVLAGTSVIAFVVGFAFIALGPRADREDKRS